MTIRRILLAAAVAALLAPASGQIAERERDREPGGRSTDRMPDGRSRTLLILKRDVDKSSEDMAKVIELATELQAEIEANEFHTVDLGSVRKAEEIMKLVRRVKSRLSRSQ